MPERKETITRDILKKPFFIADIAANHDGSLDRAINLIELAAKAGADAVKFQNFFADTIINPKAFENLNELKTHQSKWKKSVYEVYEDASLPIQWTETLMNAAKANNVYYMTTPYDISVINKCEKYVDAWKVGSGDIDWKDLHRVLSDSSKLIFLATGASTDNEVDRLINYYKDKGMSQRIILMQCNTNYTGSLDNFNHINLNVLKTYSKLYPNLLLGLSDHTPGHATVLGAIALGALTFEKHFTDDIQRAGPDHGFSMTPETWKEMVERSLELFAGLGNGIKVIEENEKDSYIVQRRGLYFSRNLKKGTILQKSDFQALRPRLEESLSPWLVEDLLGSRLVVDVKEKQPVVWDLVSIEK